jgi:hypothetical protein
MILQQNSFYPAANAPKILFVWHLRKIAPRLEALPSVTSATCAESATVSFVMWTFCAIVMASKHPKMSRQIDNSTQFQRFLKNWK